MEVLVVDVGGTSVKLWHTAHEEHRRFDSGKELTPETMIKQALEMVQDWNYDAIALGLPCRVSNGRAAEDPQNLGAGWLAFNFTSAFGKPVRVMNDASLQALGSYDGGRMVFLGLGTAVGSAFVANRLILSLDLGRFETSRGRLSELLGDKGFERLGPKEAEEMVHAVVPMIKSTMMADYIVMGGGSVSKLENLPDSVRRGHNRTVVEGGRRLWEELPDPTTKDASDWIII